MWQKIIVVAMCVVGKMAKDVGTAIRKSIVVFLPCLVTFLRFHPYMLLHFVNAFCDLFLLLFFWGGWGGGVGWKKRLFAVMCFFQSRLTTARPRQNHSPSL